MGYMTTVTCRFECDHCGAVQRDYQRTADQARQAAEEEGFIISEWLLDGCPRQTCFCPECVIKLAEKEGKSKVAR